mmetsp:Transcript_171158/g.548613  ORF Transcript_171158/g.548613 Transcript_171158/m.548613 type:complete len:311 (-) Transcript_171158:151-1083(-)
MSTRNPPYEGQGDIQAQGANESQSLATEPHRARVHLCVHGVLLVDDEDPHQHKFQDANHVVRVLGYSMVFSPPDQWLQAYEHEWQSNEEAISELNGLVPHNKEQHHTVVDQQRPPEPIGVCKACKDGQGQRSRSDFKSTHDGNSSNIHRRSPELHLLLPHCQAEPDGHEGREHRQSQQRPCSFWSISCAGPNYEGVELHQGIRSRLQNSLHESQGVEVICVAVMEDAAVRLSEDLNLHKVEEELWKSISDTAIVNVSWRRAATPERNVQARDQPRPQNHASGAKKKSPTACEPETEGRPTSPARRQLHGL